MLLQISNGLISYTLSGQTGIAGCTFFPKAVGGKDEDATQTITVIFEGTAAVIRQTANDIERLLESVKIRNATQGNSSRPRVYLLYSPQGLSTDVYRAEIKEAKPFEWASDPIKHRFTGGESATINTEAALVLRHGIWESDTLIELPLSSKTQPTVSIGGRAIQNRNDSSGGSYVDIPAGAVVGACRAPAVIVITQSQTASIAHRYFYIWATGPMALSSFNPILEGEADASGLGVDQSDSAANGGQNTTFTISGQTKGQWAISSTFVQAVGGRTVRLLGRFGFYSGSQIDVQPTLHTEDNRGEVAPANGAVRLATLPVEFRDLGQFKFPTADLPTPTGLLLELLFTSPNVVTLELDYIMLAITDDGFRRLQNLAGNLDQNVAVVDDPTLGRAYVRTVAGKQSPAADVQGTPIMLAPNDLGQRVYFMMVGDYDVDVAKQAKVQIYYRPRRYTV